MSIGKNELHRLARIVRHLDRNHLQRSDLHFNAGTDPMQPAYALIKARCAGRSLGRIHAELPAPGKRSNPACMIAVFVGHEDRAKRADIDPARASRRSSSRGENPSSIRT